MASGRRREYVVLETPSTLVSIIAQLAPPEGAEAIEQGRVFVDERRVEDPRYCVQPGARVTWYAQRPSSHEADDLPFAILDRRDDWVVAAKPAAWACEPDRTGRATSLRDAVAEELHASSVHVLTRLDVGVTGLVLLALSPSACRSATHLQSQHRILKDYFALVSGALPGSVTWNGPRCANREAKTEVHVMAAHRVLGSATQTPVTVSLLSVKPVTGRKHQIRIHAAHHGYPLMGDARYGGPTRLIQSDGSVTPVRRVMLHAYRLVIPWERNPWTTTCAPARDIVSLWTSLGGTPSELQIESRDCSS